jgi:ABC-type nitrate/sulfonate/bicarbonate transport system permease component
MKARRLRSIGLEIWLPIVLVALWWFASTGSASPYFPSLQSILVQFGDDWLSPAAIQNLVPSLELLGSGYAIAVIVGIAIGVLLGTVRALEEATRPFLEVLRAIPGVAVLPVFVVLLGIEMPMKIALIAFGCVWPVLLNTVDGVRGIEPLLLDVARSYRIGPVRRLTSIVLRGASPQIFAGARTALAIAIIIMVVAETVGGSGGIGYFLLTAERNFAITSMWGAIIALGLLGYVLNILFRLLESVVLRWHRLLQSRLEAQS